MNMKRFTKLFILAAIALLTILPACTSDDSIHGGDDVVYMLPKKTNITLTEQQRQMCDNNNEFACNLFRTINGQKQGDGSTIVSPISVSFLLGMLNAGADGETRQQITDVLGLGGSVQEINEYCKKMIEEAPYVDPSVTVKIANCIDVNSALGITLIPQYKADMQNYYQAQIDALDFTKDSSLDIINNWCDTHTDGMIPNILSKDEFNPVASLYLLNAIYFKATWTEKFDPKDSRDKDFTKADGHTAKRTFMHRKALAKYGQNDLCSMLCLPYGSHGYSMYVMLPNENKTLEDVINGMSAQALTDHLNSMYSFEVDILMPRFTTSSETRLENVLSAMGMPLAFDSNFAEFPNMAPGQNLYVAMMKQKAKIEVNEEGTKAAAVTIAEMGKSMANEPTQLEKADFHAMRPFVYFIMEESTRSIFFIGTYCGE